MPNESRFMQFVNRCRWLLRKDNSLSERFNSLESEIFKHIEGENERMAEVADRAVEDAIYNKLCNGDLISKDDVEDDVEDKLDDYVNKKDYIKMITDKLKEIHEIHP